jgi:hypothetical protein
MKSNSLWKWFVNPFEKIAGWKAFGIGIVVVGITVVLGYWGSMRFEGMNTRPLQDFNLAEAFAGHAACIFILILTMYAAALIFARATRFQDVLGTVTLSYYPYLLMPLTALFFDYNTFSDPNMLSDLMGNHQKQMALVVSLLPMALFAIVMLVWHITLLYNAFRVSTGLKGGKCVAVFIGSLVVYHVLLVLIQKIALVFIIAG